MHWTHRPLIATAVLVLMLPVTAAGWHAAGSSEPDTPYDHPGVMWQEAPTTPGRVYFNAYSMARTAATATSWSLLGVNPNSPLVESRVEPPGMEYHEAILGVWLDCDGDGYIGKAEGALREYSAMLLEDPTICPPVLGDPMVWDGASHNYNGWVTELIPIARNMHANDTRRYVDTKAAVWGDFHRPDEVGSIRSCALAPQPRGTYQSSGGALDYIDCRAPVLESFNVVVGVAGDPLGLRFADEDRGNSGALGRIATFGTEDEAHSPVRVWDCSADPAFRAGDTLNETAPGHDAALTPGQRTTLYAVHDTIVYAPASSPIGNTQDPTVPALVNHTFEGADGDCDTSNDRGEDFYGNWATFYVGEEDFNGVDPRDKRQANWNFNHTNTSRGRPATCVAENQAMPRTCSPTGSLAAGGAGADDGNHGVNLVNPSGVRWVSPSIWATKTGPALVRTTAGSPALAGAYWLTFYAYVGEETISRGLQLPGGGGKYADWHCGLATSGTPRGWNCDASLWYLNPDGSKMPDDGFLARPGQPYNLRDVDCYDGGTNLGLGVGAAFYGSDPCP